MYRVRVAPFIVVALLCIGCDHASKIAAVSLLESRAPIELANGIVRFELAYNPGAFMSLGAGLPVPLRTALFGWLVPLLVVVASMFFLRDRTLGVAALVALGLLAGGGLGNGIDRMLHDGFVTDFVSLGVGGLRTGIFNVADLAVIAGVIATLWAGAAATPDDEPPASP